MTFSQLFILLHKVYLTIYRKKKIIEIKIYLFNHFSTLFHTLFKIVLISMTFTGLEITFILSVETCCGILNRCDYVKTVYVMPFFFLLYIISKHLKSCHTSWLLWFVKRFGPGALDPRSLPFITHQKQKKYLTRQKHMTSVGFSTLEGHKNIYIFFLPVLQMIHKDFAAIFRYFQQITH